MLIAATAPVLGAVGSTVRGVLLLPAWSVQKRLSFPGEGRGARAEMLLSGLGLSAPTRAGQESCRSAGTSAGAGLERGCSAQPVPAGTLGGLGGSGVWHGGSCYLTRVRGAVSALPWTARQCPALAWWGQGTARRRGTMPTCPWQPPPSYSPAINYSYVFIIHTTL